MYEKNDFNIKLNIAINNELHITLCNVILPDYILSFAYLFRNIFLNLQSKDSNSNRKIVGHRVNFKKENINIYFITYIIFGLNMHQNLRKFALVNSTTNERETDVYPVLDIQRTIHTNIPLNSEH